MKKYKVIEYFLTSIALLTILICGFGIGTYFESIIYPIIKWILINIIVFFLPTTTLIASNQYEKYVQSSKSVIVLNIVSIGSFYIFYFMFQSVEAAMAIVFLTVVFIVESELR